MPSLSNLKCIKHPRRFYKLQDLCKLQDINGANMSHEDKKNKPMGSEAEKQLEISYKGIIEKWSNCTTHTWINIVTKINTYIEQIIKTHGTICINNKHIVTLNTSYTTSAGMKKHMKATQRHKSVQYYYFFAIAH